MKVRITVSRRAEIADPQGSTVVRALHQLGYEEVKGARFDRSIVLEVEGDDSNAIRGRVEEMCARLLVNPVLEDYQVAVEG